MHENTLNPYDHPYQCEMDLEDFSQRSRQRGYQSSFTCAVCGAGAEMMENLCAPEKNQSLGA